MSKVAVAHGQIGRRPAVILGSAALAAANPLLRSIESRAVRTLARLGLAVLWIPVLFLCAFILVAVIYGDAP